MAKSKNASKQASKNASRAQSGTATPVSKEALEPAVALPAIVGINFGQSFSSVAIINKEGLADCIANDDGERQIATAVSFNGEEEYFGVPARVQLVRNQDNTILAFRNLLGKTYDEVKSVKQPSNSAPIVDLNGSPAFKVEINGASTTLSAHDVAVRYLKVLSSYATDFLGRKITAAVLSVPASASDKQVAAIVKAAEDAGIPVVQTISEAAAALTAYHSTDLSSSEDSTATSSSIVDRNSVVLDVGGTSTSATVLAVRDGLFVPLSSSSDSSLGGDLFDDKLIDWFSKEFTKKTRITLDKSNHRALMKLRLAVEVTKKSLSASNTAPCSVESLAEGLDFHGSVNRMRFDLLAGGVYDKVVAVVEKALSDAKVDPLHVQEVILVGGTSKLPKLSDKLLNLLPESASLRNVIESDEVLAKGAALQALSVSQTYPSDNAALVEAHKRSQTESTVVSPSVLSQPIGLLVDPSQPESFVSLVAEQSPLPVRRIVDLEIPAGSTQVLVSLWEGAHEIKVEKPEPKAKKTESAGGVAGFFGKKKEVEEDDEDDEDEDEETRTAVVKATHALADLTVNVDSSKTPAPKVRVTIIVDANGKGTATGVQLKSGAETASAQF
ncbi:actin-like ATPase domain-containing protein [Meredithblackwellia eburnea MCA 4105]